MIAKTMSVTELTEQLLALQRSNIEVTGTPEERALARLGKDLSVHQLELLLQNEQLRAAQAALEESRNRYADLYDFSPMAYYTLDTKGCIRESNLAGAALLGRDRQQLIGLPFLSHVRMDEPGDFWEHLRRSCRERRAVTSELAFGTARAEKVCVQAVSTPVIDAAGEVTALRTAMTDITARKDAEIERDRAWQSERTLRRRMDSIDRAMVEVTEALARLGQTGSLQTVLQVVVDQAREVLETSYALFGVADGADKPFDAWVFSGVEPDLRSAIGRTPRAIGVRGAAMAGGSVLRVRDVREHPAFAGFPDNHPVLKSLIAVPVRRGARVFGYLYFADKRSGAELDAEDERTAELLAERVAAALEIARLHDAARAASAAREHLLAIVSHDLRNPLSIIALNATQLLHTGPHDAGVQHPAEVIKRTTARMGRLIQDLLQVATLEAGELTIELRAEDPLRIADESVEAQRPMTSAVAVRLERDPSPDLPRVRCDRERVLQVLANLIGNAAKFTPEGGEIHVRVAQEGDHVRFSVADTGAGIPADEIPKLFERYWKGKDEKRQGTGLGLSIVKGIVQAHHGKIDVRSAPGAGTTISFTLPISHEPVVEPVPAPAPAPLDVEQLRGKRILVVDDEQNAVAALAMLLGCEGLQAFEATSGEEALAMFDEARPDALLLDMEMPGMNGLVLLDHARERRPDLPAIVMSGYPPDNADIRAALRGRDVGYLSKPVDLDELLVLLGRLTSKPNYAN